MNICVQNQWMMKFIFSVLMGSVCILQGTIQQSPDVGLYGNWVKKQEWQKVAEAFLSEMDGIYVSLETYDADQYQPKYADADRQFNDFYKKIGIARSSVATLLEEVKKDLVQRLQESLSQDGDLDIRRVDAEQRAFQLEREIKQIEFDIKQLELDMKLVETFDQELGARYARVQEFLTMAQNKRVEALQVFEELAVMLDDRKAREKYYYIEGCLDQLKQLQDFFTRTFFNDFQDVIQKAAQHMQQVEASIRQLEEKGAVINNRSTVLEELKVKKAEEEARLLKKTEEARQFREKNKQVPIERPIGFMERLFQWFGLVWYIVTDIVTEVRTTIFSYIWGDSLEEKEIKQERVSELNDNEKNQSNKKQESIVSQPMMQPEQKI